MFKSLVSNLPFSPALIGQLGFYARRLKQEETTRKLGLIFTALAVVVQSFAVFSPPEAQAVASNQNIIYQGVRDKSDFLRIYDANTDSQNHRDIQQIYSYFGVTRADIERAQEGTFNSRSFNLGIWSVGRNSYDAGTEYEQAHAIPGTSSTVFARKLWRFDKLPYTQKNGSTYKGLIGKKASDGTWFAISYDCGNLAFTNFPPPPPTPEAACNGLTIHQINRTRYRLNATASVKNGASISSYDFVVNDAAGKQAAAAQVKTNTGSAQAEITLPKDGNYTALVTVQTSLGPRGGGSCQQPLTVSPEPRCPVNNSIVESNPKCKPCPSDSTIWYQDATCKPDFKATKKVKNTTQNIEDANGTTAKPGDKLTYTLRVENTGKDSGDYTMKENIGDVLEYANILEADGGTLEKDSAGNTTGILTWKSEKLAPAKIITKTIIVQVKEQIPASPQNVGNPESYNCVMTNGLGTTTNVSVECPPAKVVENTIQQLPSTGPGENMVFGGLLIMAVTYFYARSRQLNKEVRLVRREFATGAI